MYWRWDSWRWRSVSRARPPAKHATSSTVSTTVRACTASRFWRAVPPASSAALCGDQHIGDHVLFLGEVERYAHGGATPLLFCNGQFQQGVNLAPTLANAACPAV